MISHQYVRLIFTLQNDWFVGIIAGELVFCFHCHKWLEGGIIMFRYWSIIFLWATQKEKKL